MATSIDILVRLRQAGGQVISKLNTDINKLKANMDDLRQVSENLVQQGVRLTALGAGITAAFAVPVRAAANFETSLSKVRAVIQENVSSTAELETQFEALKDRAEELGRTTQFTATEAADALEILTRQGFSAQESVDSLAGVLNIAAVETLGLQESATIAAGVLRGFGLEAADFNNTVDQLTAASLKSSASLVGIGEALKTAAPVAAGANISLQETLTVLGQLANAQIKGTRAGTAFRAVIAALVNPSDDAANALRTLGVNTIDETTGNLRSFEDILAQLRTGLDNTAGSAERTSLIVRAFGERGGPAINALLQQGVDAFRDFGKEIENSGGIAQRVADTRLENLSGAFTRLLSALEGFLIAVGEPFLGFLRRMVDALASALTAVTGFFESLGPFGTAITATIGVLGVLITAVGLLTTALGAAGLGVLAVQTGLTALNTIIPVVAARMGILRAIFNTTFLKITLLIGLVIALFNTEWIESLEVSEIAVRDWVTAVILVFEQWANRIAIFFLRVGRLIKQVFTLNQGDLSSFDKAIQARLERIEVLDDAISRTLRKSLESSRKAREGAEKEADKIKQSPSLNIPLPELATPRSTQEKFLAERERELAMFVATVETKLAEIRAARQRGALDEETVLNARRSLLEQVFAREIELLRERLKIERDIEAQNATKLEIFEKEQQLRRDLIALDTEERQLRDNELARLTELESKFIAIERRALGTSIADLRRRHELELDEIESRNAKELVELQKKGVRLKQLDEIIATQRQGVELVRARQAEEIRERESRIQEGLAALERQTFGKTIADRRRANQLILAEVKRANERQIEELVKAGATREQIREAQINAELALTRKGAQLEQEAIAEQQRMADERAQKEQELNDTLRAIRQEALGDSDPELSAQLELDALRDKFAQQIEELRKKGATEAQIIQAQEDQKLAIQRRAAELEQAIIDQRLAVAETSLGQVSQLLDNIVQLTGSRNKALFAAAKAAAIAEATVNIARGISAALALGPILGPIQAAIVAALGATQIAKITAQRLATGGMVLGGSGRRDDVPILAMGGEYMMRKSSVQHYGAPFMEAINRQQIPMQAANALAGSLPAARTGDGSYQGGGEVSRQAPAALQSAQRPINILNFQDPQQIDTHLASTAGGDNLINVLFNRREDVRNIVFDG